jgi:cell division protein FtsA
MLMKTTVLPFGGEYITNDISIGLRTQTDVAERVKLKYGIASIEDANEEIKFKVSRIGSNVEKEFNQKELAYIIEPRIREMFQLIQQEVYRLGFEKEVAGGYVLTGGVTAINGILPLAQEELKPSVRISVPDFIGVKDPSYTGGVGVILYASKYFMKRGNNNATSASKTKRNVQKTNSTNTMERIKNWFSEFI